MNDPFYDSTSLLFNHLRKRLVQDRENTSYEIEDSNEHRVIGHHYANSHFGAGCIVYGHFIQNKEVTDLGIKTIETFIRKSKTYETYVDFHFDFNNFALSVLWILNNKKSFLPEALNQSIENYLLTTADSRHYTVNWLLMRQFNNIVRYKISSKKKYHFKAILYKQLVRKAINPDGRIDDRLPKGKSANPQYHAFSLSLMFLGKQLEITNWPDEIINSGLNWIEALIDPMGDFNYFGRGSNQIFGWSSMLFLARQSLFSVVSTEKLFAFYNQNITTCLKNDSLMLESSSPEKRLTWYDYHYASVYQSHLFFWNSLIDVPYLSIKTKALDNSKISDSSALIIDTPQVFTCVFKGTEHYIAEKGPQISNITIKDFGTVFKGPFGPFQSFGNKSPRKTHGVENYLGPITESYIDQETLQIKPIFPEHIQIKQNSHSVDFEFVGIAIDVVFNIPLFKKEHIERFSLKDRDGNFHPFHYIGTTLNPYGEVFLFRTRILQKPTTLTLILKLIS